MKIDSAKLKKSHTEPPADCAELIEKLCAQSYDELRDTLTKITTWTVGKCELYHWVAVLDKFDEILGEACSTIEGHQWQYKVDGDKLLRDLVLGILNFTALLIEYSCSRHIYNSIDHVISLMCVADLEVTHSVLNLLYTFTKRSTFLTRLNQETRKRLIAQLTYLADSWGGKENGYGLAECCDEKNVDNAVNQKSATTLHFEFRVEDDAKKDQNPIESKIESIYIQNISQFEAPLGQIMEELLEMYSRLPKNLQMKLYTQLRLAHSFGRSSDRLKCVQVRLHAISVLVFMSSSESAMSPVLYPGFVEEIVDLLQLPSGTDNKLIEIKAAALRTITSIVHLDHPPRLVTIIDATGSGEYHGLLPTLIRQCITSMTATTTVTPATPTRFPHSLSTALFSFLYHLSSYESGAEALVSSGMVESLLNVIKLIGDQQDEIMFVTRAVRIVDLVTNVEMTSFQGLKGVQIFIDRLEREVTSCRLEAPVELEPKAVTTESMDIDESTKTEFTKKGVQCMPQRSALFKSILNFLKKTIQDQTMTESIRHIMETSLPNSIRHIVSNCDYYGASLFLVALEVVQFYVFHEPSLLSNMQETGITDVILQALLIKGPPATKEVLAALPNIFTALCMNENGLNEFKRYNPFEKMFKVLINQDYLQAMKRRRSSESAHDTAAVLGSSVDELMRHQNSLRKPAIAAAIAILHQLVEIGNNPDTVCIKTGAQQEKVEVLEALAQGPQEPRVIDNDSQSDEDTETMDEVLEKEGSPSGMNDNIPKKQKLMDRVPLMDYIVNVCKFLDSMLSNNNTPDHCKEFIQAGGVPVLLKLVTLRALPLEFPTSQAAQQIAQVLRVVFVLAKDMSVLKATVKVVKEWLDKYEEHSEMELPKLSIESPSLLLREYSYSTSDCQRDSQQMVVFQYTSKIYSFVALLQNMTNNVQNEARSICVNVWGSEIGLKVIAGFARVYRNLIWESTAMVDIIEDKKDIEGFGRVDLDRMITNEADFLTQSTTTSSTTSSATTPIEPAPPSGASPTSVLQNEVRLMDIGSPAEGDQPIQESQAEIKRKMVKSVPYQAAQELGAKLSTFFQLLVKFSTTTQRNTRRSQAKVAPSIAARVIATELVGHVKDTLRWEPPMQMPSTRFRLLFQRSAAQLAATLLLDDNQAPLHLMLQHLDASNGLDTVEKALYEGVKGATGEELDVILDKDELPSGVGEYLSEWFALIEKIIDFRKYDQRVNERSPSDLPDSYMVYHVPFKRASFLAQVHKIAFRAIKLMWGRKSLKGFGSKKDSPKLLENLLTVLRHIIKSEKFIQHAIAAEDEQTEVNFNEVKNVLIPHFLTIEEQDLEMRSEFDPYCKLLIQRLVSGINIQELLDEAKNIDPEGFIDKLYSKQSIVDDANSSRKKFSNDVTRRMISSFTQLTQNRFDRVRQLTSSLENSSLRQDLERIRNVLEGEVHNQVERHSNEFREQNLQTMFSMGYNEALATRALEATSNNLTEAIEFCLNNPEGEDDLEMAIRLSLGGCTVPLETQPGASVATSAAAWNSESDEDPPVNLVESPPPARVRAFNPVPSLTSLDKLKKLSSENIARFAGCLAAAAYMKNLERPSVSPIDASDIKEFSENMTSGCFQMLEDDPKAVYSVSDLLIATMRRNDESWTQQAIRDSVNRINTTAKDVFEKQKSFQGHPDELQKASQQLSTGLLLLTLLFDEAKMNCAKAIDAGNLMSTIVELLSLAKSVIESDSDNVPKWVSSSLLLADLYQKISLADERRKLLKNQHPGQQVVWKSFEERDVRWKTYSADDQLILYSAYEKGEDSCRLNSGRRKYTICFNRMLQLNEDSPTRRPIMRFYGDKSVTPEPTDQSSRLSDEQAQHLIECCIALCARPTTDSDTVHSSLRIILRVTRKHNLALNFAENGGLEMLFKLTQTQGFAGFYSIASLLVRHLLESPGILRSCFEKSVRQMALQGASQTAAGVQAKSGGVRELNFLLRQLSPIACRDPELFVEVVQKQLKINIRNYHSGKENSIINGDLPGELTINKDQGKKDPIIITSELKRVLQLLVDKLAQFSADQDKDMEDEPPKPKPLLSQNLLLRILAELINSYPACANTLCKLKITDTDSNILQFVMDNLLMTKVAGTTENDTLGLNLLASFAACDSTKVKNFFIAELKSGLARVVRQPESSQKHNHFRAIVDLVLVAIKRNSSQTSKSFDNLRNVIRNNGNDKEINTLSILMVKRGVVQDLARSIHTLDLSSPHLAQTLNIVLRALETLSKVTGISLSQRGDGKKSKLDQARRSVTTVDLDAFIMPPPANPDDITETETDQASNMDYEDEVSQESATENDTDVGGMCGEIPELQDLYLPDTAMPDDGVDDEIDEGDEDGDEADEDGEHEEDFTESDYLLGDRGLTGDDLEDDINRSDEEDEDDDDEESLEFPLPADGGHYATDTYEILSSQLYDNEFNADEFGPMDMMSQYPSRMYPFDEPIGRFRNAGVGGVRSDTTSYSLSRLRRAHARTRGTTTANSTQQQSAENSARSILQPLNPVHPLLTRVNASSGRDGHGPRQSQNARDYILHVGRNPIAWDQYPSYASYMSWRNRLRSHYSYYSPQNFFSSHRNPRGLDGRAGFPTTGQPLNFLDLLPDAFAIRNAEENCSTEANFPSAFYRWAEEAAVLEGESIHDITLLVRDDVLPTLMDRLKIEGEEKDKIRKEHNEKRRIEKESKLKELMEKRQATEAAKADSTTPSSVVDETPGTIAVPQPNTSFAELLNQSTDVDSGDIPQLFTDAIESAVPTITLTSETPVEPTTPVEPRSINPWEQMDPSILNELPEDVRREVYASVLDNVRRDTTTVGETTTLAPINSEFLNALPTFIREEVTQAHERVNSDLQTRATTQAAAATSTPETSECTSNETWIRSLGLDLRRTILQDMADENIEALPSDLQREARQLRQQQRHSMGNAFDQYVRRRTIRPPFTGRPNFMSQRLRPDPQDAAASKKHLPSLSPKYTIDAESLSCILAVLFLNDNGIQQRKLHMILKNFAMHGSTCNWLIKSLLDIIQRTSPCQTADDGGITIPCWLSLKLEASLGARHSVFQIRNSSSPVLEIHPQAASYICRSVLDSLTYLAKWNTRFFNATTSTSSVPSFWDLLLKLEKDSSSPNFGKKPDQCTQLHNKDDEPTVVKDLEQLDRSVFASLLRMLKHPVITDSKSLLDKTLSLIAIVTSDLPVITSDQGTILTSEISNLVTILGRVNSEEGTADCTQILIALSKCHISFRIQVLDELLAGAATLGKKLELQLGQLLDQLKNRSTDNEVNEDKPQEFLLPAMQLLTSKNSVQASFLRLLKIVEELRRADFGSTSNKIIRWGENGIRNRMGLSRGSWRSNMRHFDETLNNVIHAAISRNRPDTAETIIDVMERQLSGRHVRLPEEFSRFMRTGQRIGIGQGTSLRAEPGAAENEPKSEGAKKNEKLKNETPCLNQPLAELLNLANLWQILSDSLGQLDVNTDSHTFMVLQPAVETFFMVHAPTTDREAENKETKKEMLAHINDFAPLGPPPPPNRPKEGDEVNGEKIPLSTLKFLQFAEKHKAVLNQILRQSSTPLADGPFSVLTKHIKVLDFDIKRRYFRRELDKIKETTQRGDTAIHVNRETIFDDSFRELHRKKADDWKSKLYIVFNNEEGQDAGGLLREWFLVISRQMFNPNYALFAQAANDRVTYRINPHSNVNPTDKLYFNFVGHVVAKAVLDNKLLECYFTRAFYKHILGVRVTYKDMEAEDLELYRSLLFLINNPVADLGYEITFSMDFERFGQTETIDIKPDGRNIIVTDDNKHEYVQLMCQEKLVGSVQDQLRAFLKGFYDIIPQKLISIFDEHELELLISGLPNIDIDDLKTHTEYQKYNSNSLQIQWFWRALKSFDQAERAKFLQFVTGTSKVPLQGFAHLEGMNGVQKFQIHRDERSTSRLPCAHTCFNQLDLPVYETYEKLRTQMLKAITESSEGFGLA